MKHIHTSTGEVYEIGHIVDRENPNTTYEMTVVMYFGNDDNPPLIVGYYFGSYSVTKTDFLIDRWLIDQEEHLCTLEGLNKYLYNYMLTNADVLDTDTKREIETLEFNLNLMLYDKRDRYYRVNGEKIDRHQYLLYVRDLYLSGKIDNHTRESLMKLACNFEEE